jgi:hypothetical protein
MRVDLNFWIRNRIKTDPQQTINYLWSLYAGPNVPKFRIFVPGKFWLR